jgi:hypothetical protein
MEHPPSQTLNYQYTEFCFLSAVLEFELMAYTLSHSTSPFFVMGFFEIGRVSGTICIGCL